MTAASATPVSLLLPNRNNEPVLDLFLSRLCEHTSYPNLELVVVDDGSTDGSRAVLERWRRSGRLPEMTIVSTAALGIVSALNTGLARVCGEIVVRLDGDATIETPGWLPRMLDFHRLHPQVGVVTGRVVLDDGRLQSAGLDVVSPEGVHDRGCAITEPVGQRTRDTCVARLPAAEVPLAAEVAEVDAAIGCCQLFSASLAREIGGWDRCWSPVWFEDFDFALSARRLGLKVFYLPDVRIVHRVGMRNPRESGRRWESALLSLRRGVGRHAPRGLRAAVARMARLGELDPERRALLEHHYAYFARKWGFDPLNPNMDAVLARHGHTEVCWAYEPGMRRTGEDIVAAWQARTTHSPAEEAEEGKSG